MGESGSGETLVHVHKLCKHYGPIRAVDDISFEARRGDVLGFLGPNGAGKTTAMKIITGFLAPDSGSVTVAGHDIATQPLAASRRIGYLPENAPAYGEMTVQGFLEFVAEARQLEPPAASIQRAIDLTELGRVRHQTIDTLSKGFKRRVGLAQALIHEPDILILDEPTDGLDPNQKALVQDLLGTLSRGRCIILSTHILDEAEKICNRAVIISQGKILQDSTPQELIARAPNHNVVSLTVPAASREAARQILNQQAWCERAEPVAESRIDVYPVGGESHLAEVARLLADFEIVSIQQQEGRLDETFRQLTKGVAA